MSEENTPTAEEQQKAYEDFAKNAIGLGSDVISIMARFNCAPEAAALAGSHIVVRAIDAVLATGNKEAARNLARQMAAGLIHACREREIDLQPAPQAQEEKALEGAEA